MLCVEFFSSVDCVREGFSRCNPESYQGVCQVQLHSPLYDLQLMLVHCLRTMDCLCRQRTLHYNNFSIINMCHQFDGRDLNVLRLRHLLARIIYIPLWHAVYKGSDLRGRIQGASLQAVRVIVSTQLQYLCTEHNPAGRERNFSQLQTLCIISCDNSSFMMAVDNRYRRCCIYACLVFVGLFSTQATATGWW